MHKKLNMNDLIDSNPKVDKKQLAEALAVLGKLRQIGVQGAEYNLEPPFGGNLAETPAEPASGQAKIRVRR